MSSAGSSSPWFFIDMKTVECLQEECRRNGVLVYYVAEWVDYAEHYRVFDIFSPWWIVAYIEAPDDLPGLSLHFYGGPLAGQHSYPLDITVLTDTDDKDIPY